jgi:hypothetical protein
MILFFFTSNFENVQMYNDFNLPLKILKKVLYIENTILCKQKISKFYKATKWKKKLWLIAKFDFKSFNVLVLEFGFNK